MGSKTAGTCQPARRSPRLRHLMHSSLIHRCSVLHLPNSTIKPAAGYGPCCPKSSRWRVVMPTHPTRDLTTWSGLYSMLSAASLSSVSLPSSHHCDVATTNKQASSIAIASSIVMTYHKRLAEVHTGKDLVLVSWIVPSSYFLNKNWTRKYFCCNKQTQNILPQRFLILR